MPRRGSGRHGQTAAEARVAEKDEAIERVYDEMHRKVRLLQDDRTKAEFNLKQAEDEVRELRTAMRNLSGKYNELSAELERWQEEARSYCQNASYHRQKREQAEAEVERRDRMLNAHGLDISEWEEAGDE